MSSESKEIDLWYVGVGLGQMAALAGIFGNYFVRRHHVRMAENLVQKSFHDPYWVFGIFLLVVINTSLNLTALLFAAQSLLAPMAGMTVVWNMLLSPCLLDENRALSDLFGTAWVVAGAALSASFGPHSTDRLSADGVVETFTRPVALVYFAVLLVVCISMALGFTATKWHALQRLAHPALAGTIGGTSTMWAKCTVMILNGASEGSSDMGNVWAWVVFVLAGVFGVLQVKVLNGALQNYEALSVVPVYSSFLLIAGALSGGIAFGEFESMPPRDLGLFFLGGIFVVCGILIITISRPDEEEVLRKKQASQAGNINNAEGRAEQGMTLTPMDDEAFPPPPPGDHDGDHSDAKTHEPSTKTAASGEVSVSYFASYTSNHYSYYLSSDESDLFYS